MLCGHRHCGITCLLHSTPTIDYVANHHPDLPRPQPTARGRLFWNPTVIENRSALTEPNTSPSIIGKWLALCLLTNDQVAPPPAQAFGCTRSHPPPPHLNGDCCLSCRRLCAEPVRESVNGMAAVEAHAFATNLAHPSPSAATATAGATPTVRCAMLACKPKQTKASRCLVDCSGRRILYIVFASPYLANRRQSDADFSTWAV